MDIIENTNLSASEIQKAFAIFMDKPKSLKYSFCDKAAGFVKINF